MNRIHKIAFILFWGICSTVAASEISAQSLDGAAGANAVDTPTAPASKEELREAKRKEKEALRLQKLAERQARADSLSRKFGQADADKGESAFFLGRKRHEKDSLACSADTLKGREVLDKQAAENFEKPKVAPKPKNMTTPGLEELELNDSLFMAEGSMLSYPVTEKKKDPTRAALYSAVVPGLGQFYGGSQWWMAPVFWGGMVGTMCGYIYYNDFYRNFRNEYKWRVAGNPPKRYEFFDNTTLASKMQQAEQQRDLFLVYTAAIYILNIIHANVSVQLAEFKKDKKRLSMAPAFIDTRSLASGNGMPASGLAFKLDF